jgi:hypothetical protein
MTPRLVKVTLLLVSIGFCHATLGQQLQPVRLYKHPNGVFNNVVAVTAPQDKIFTNRPLVIRARYYSKSGAPSILVFNLTDDVNNVKLRYPVAIFDKDDTKEVIFYGPQFYDGRNEFKITPEILVLKSEQYAKYKDTFTKFFGTALSLVPVLGQASKFIDMGWKTAEDVLDLDKNKTEKFDPIIIRRDVNATMRIADNPQLATLPTWYVMANKDAAPAISSQLASGFRDPDGSDRPGLTANLGKGRALFVSIIPDVRALSSQEISERVNAFFDSARDRLDKANLETNNPFSGETVQADLEIRRNFETFLSTIEFVRSLKDLNSDNQAARPTTENAVKALFANFKAGQQAAPGTPFVKLKPVLEQQVAAKLSRLFEFRTVSGATITEEEPGLRNLIAWSNWLDKRVTATGVNPAAITFNEIQSFSSGALTVGPFAKANPSFAIKSVENLLPANASTSQKIEERLKAMQANIKKLREVKDIFNSTDSNPWLRFEQRAAAEWIVSHLQGMDPLPSTDFKSDDDVKRFADKLDQFLTTAKVFEPINAANKVWRFRPIVEYVEEDLRTKLRSVATNQQVLNKHDALENVYFTVVNPALDFMTKEEKETVAASLAERFPKDVGGKSLSIVVPRSYFDNTILTTTLVGGAPEILVAGTVAASDNRDVATMLQRIKFTDASTTPNTSDLSSKLNVPKSSLNTQRRNALRAVFTLVQTPGIDFSIALRGVDYISKMVAINSPPARPTNRTELQTWITVMSPQITNSTWKEDMGRFVPSTTLGGADPDVVLIKEQLTNGCDPDAPVGTANCSVEPSGVDATGKALIQRLYDIICDVAGNSAIKRSQAEDVLRDFIDVPQAVLTAAPEKCSVYTTTYAVNKLVWREGKYRLLPPPPAPAPPTQ